MSMSSPSDVPLTDTTPGPPSRSLVKVKSVLVKAAKGPIPQQSKKHEEQNQKMQQKKQENKQENKQKEKEMQPAEAETETPFTIAIDAEGQDKASVEDEQDREAGSPGLARVVMGELLSEEDYVIHGVAQKVVECLVDFLEELHGDGEGGVMVDSEKPVVSLTSKIPKAKRSARKLL